MDGASFGRRAHALRPALICAAAALALRAVYLVSAAGNPFWRHLGLDMAGYDQWARAVLAGRGLGEAPFSQAPFFPLVLSVAYALLGPDPVRALWFHLLPGSLAVFLAAHVAGRWRGPTAAWGAGILLALYKPAIFYTGVLLPPTWVLFLSAACLWLTAETVSSLPGAQGKGGRASAPNVPRGDQRWSMVVLPAVTGLAFGFLALAQPAAAVAVLPAAWWIGREARSRAGTTVASTAAPSGGGGSNSQRARRSATSGAPAKRVLSWFGLGLSLPIVASTLYNGVAGNAWSAVAVNGGINLYIGNGPEANGAYVRPPGMREDRDLLGLEAARAAADGKSAAPAGAATFGPAEANRYWTGRALHEMVLHPLRTAGLYLRKLAFFFGQYEVPEVESLPFEQRYSYLLRLPGPGMALLVALALLGSLVLWRRDPQARWLAASGVAIALGVSVFFVTARFRLAGAPFLAVLAGAGLAELRGRREIRSSATALGISAVVGVLLCLNLTGINARASEGQYHFRLGAILEKDGRAEAATGEYRQALALDPTLGKAEVNLGTLLARQGKLGDARTHLERGVTLDPLSGIGYLNLGQLHQIAGDRPGALSLYKQALAVDPTLVSARESKAYLVYEAGVLREARLDLESIARLVPAGSPSAERAHTLLGILTERTAAGDTLWWSSTPLRQGDLRLSQGDREGARRLYQQALGQSSSAEVARRMLERLGSGGAGARP